MAKYKRGSLTLARRVKELERQARKASGPEKEQLQAQAKAIRERVENEARGKYYNELNRTTPSAAPTLAPASAPSGKVMTMADVIATAAARRLPVEQVRADAIEAGYTIR